MKLLVSFGILFCVGFALSHEENYSVSSREEVYTLDGYTYFFSGPFKTDWYGAHEYCRYRGMHLVDIPTHAEHQRLLSLVLNLSKAMYPEKRFWTSGTDLGREGQFVWMASGHPLTYTNWLLGQPDNVLTLDKKETENCIEFTEKSWTDNHCSLKKAFICRNKIIRPFLLKPSPECY